MLRKQNKKGFTLAELLIVVAIIAVLVAIAVPLFVGALDNAQEARDNANIRAVRGAAVVYLLENSGDTTKVWTADAKQHGWDVKATISSSGDITEMTVEVAKAPVEGVAVAPDACKSKGDGNFEVTLHLTNTDVSSLVDD